ncbi:MAG: class I SAM-dependent methyltransferase, partial [Nocardioidaceae bacterium]|nr:class I SAM-dependent methyltransferase [Nocardioidaceae bacterium]
MGEARASTGWLALREPADAAARAADLVDVLRPDLPGHGVLEVHDLGSGTGSMARWVAARLDGPQHWVLHDRDEELLDHAGAHLPPSARDGAAVTVETRRDDITRLDPGALAGAGLVTASALLDMMTAAELDRLVTTCAAAECPVLVALSVNGRVELTPPDDVDETVRDAFNAHQRRDAGAGPLLGPDAAAAALRAFRKIGRRVQTRPSPWTLGADQAALTSAWFEG